MAVAPDPVASARRVEVMTPAAPQGGPTVWARAREAFARWNVGRQEPKSEKEMGWVSGYASAIKDHEAAPQGGQEVERYTWSARTGHLEGSTLLSVDTVFVLGRDHDALKAQLDAMTARAEAHENVLREMATMPNVSGDHTRLMFQAQWVRNTAAAAIKPYALDPACPKDAETRSEP